MKTNPRTLRPSELCGLLNSTPLGEVIGERQLHRHRTRAGLRIGDGKHVDLLRYVAWLLQERQARKTVPAEIEKPPSNIPEAAQGAAVLASRLNEPRGHGQKYTRKREALIAALLTEPTHEAAAKKSGISPATFYRWMHVPEFRKAYREARRELVEAAIGRVQAGAGEAVETLLEIARRGKRDGDRVRASLALLDHALNGLTNADVLHGSPEAGEEGAMATGDVVQLLGVRLRQIDRSALSTDEKARLTATLTDAFLRAFGVDQLDKRLESIEGVLLARKENQ